MIKRIRTRNKNVVHSNWKEAVLTGDEESIQSQIDKFKTDGFEVEELSTPPTHHRCISSPKERELSEEDLDGVGQVIYEGTKYSIGNRYHGDVELYRYNKFYKIVSISDVKPVKKNTIKSGKMELIKFTSQKHQKLSKEMPLHISRRGEVSLSAHFVQANKLQDMKHCLFYASKDGSKVEMYLSAEKIEGNDFEFYDSKKNQRARHGQLLFGAINISEQLKITETWFYKLTSIKRRTVHPENTKIKGLIKLSFELSQKINLGHGKTDNSSVSSGHSALRNASSSAGPGSKAKKTGAVNNTDFPRVHGRQPWIRCTGCGGYKKPIEWVLKNEKLHIGLCIKCHAVPSKIDAFDAKVQELEGNAG